MTVKEFKENLKPVPDDLVVAFVDDCGNVEMVERVEMSFTIVGSRPSLLVLRGEEAEE